MKTKPGLLLKTDGTVHTVMIPKAPGGMLNELYKLIDCGTVQCVDVIGTRFKIWCDEEGKLNGSKPNAAATRLAGIPGDVIMGDVVVMT